MEALANLHPVMQALLATLFTWAMTMVGAIPVFFTKHVNQKLMDGLLGMAAGVMIAASFWSLLAPAITLSEDMGHPAWFPPLIGFLGGGACLWGIDKILPHLHPGLAMSDAEGVSTSWRRSTLLVLAITLHNFPEGLAVGVAFGAAAADTAGASVTGPVALALGIGLQNLPEGIAVAMPLRREGWSRFKSFMYGRCWGWSSLLRVSWALPWSWSCGRFYPMLWPLRRGR